MNKLEKDLWAKMDEVIGTDEDMDIIQILTNIDDESFLEKLDGDDMILGLSGVDDDAIPRLKRRRDIIESLKQREEKIKKDREEGLKKMMANREARHQKQLAEAVERLAKLGKKV